MLQNNLIFWLNSFAAATLAITYMIAQTRVNTRRIAELQDQNNERLRTHSAALARIDNTLADIRVDVAYIRGHCPRCDSKHDSPTLSSNLD